jgi:hypothetical protein
MRVGILVMVLLLVGEGGQSPINLPQSRRDALSLY